MKPAAGQPHGQLDGTLWPTARAWWDGRPQTPTSSTAESQKPRNARPRRRPRGQIVSSCSIVCFGCPPHFTGSPCFTCYLPWRRLTSSAPHRPLIAPRTHAPLLPVAALTGPHHREDSSPAARRSAPMDRWPCSGLPVPGRPHR